MRKVWVIIVAVALAAAFGAIAPANAGALQRGQYYAAHGKDRLAIAQFTRAIAHGPRAQASLARFYRARVYVALGNYRAAAADFATVTRTHPGWHKAQTGLAWSLHRLGWNSEALPHALAAVRLAPTDWYAQSTLGDIALKLGDLPSAAAAYRTVWRGDPNRRQIMFVKLYNMGAIYDIVMIA